jgi:hypothetical protein
MSEDRWPAYWSLAAAPALEGRYAFAFMPARAAQDMADKFGVDIEPAASGNGEGARVVVVVRRDGSHAAKTGVQSRKALTRFLLKNQWELVPQVCLRVCTCVRMCVRKCPVNVCEKVPSQRVGRRPTECLVIVPAISHQRLVSRHHAAPRTSGYRKCLCPPPPLRSSSMLSISSPP